MQTETDKLAAESHRATSEALDDALDPGMRLASIEWRSTVGDKAISRQSRLATKSADGSHCYQHDRHSDRIGQKGVCRILEVDKQCRQVIGNRLAAAFSRCNFRQLQRQIGNWQEP